MSITRIPATVVATASGAETPGKVVVVVVEELDRLEASAEKVVAMLGTQSNPRRDGGSRALVEACYELALAIDGGEVSMTEGDG